MYQKRERNFRAGEPVLITDRCNFRLDLLVHPLIREGIKDALVYYAAHCEVEVLGFALLGNHWHLICTQEAKKMDLVKGIAPFMRNVKSTISNLLRRELDVVGPKFQSRYKAHKLQTGEEFLSSLAYVLGQAERHGLAPEDVCTSRAVLDGAVDAVTAVPRFVGLQGRSAEKRLRSLGALIDDVIATYASLLRTEPAPEESTPRERSEHDRELRRAAVEMHATSEQLRVRMAPLACFAVPHIPVPAVVTLPPMQVFHVRSARTRRVLRTRLIDFGRPRLERRIEWALRIDEGQRARRGRLSELVAAPRVAGAAR